MGAFFVMSISAWYLLKRRHEEFARRSFSGALILAALASLAALAGGHFQAKNVYRYQPAKLAAFEGHFNSGPADLSLFGIPDAERERIDYNIAIPGGLSFLVHEEFDRPLLGLDAVRPDQRPPVLIPFLSYHVMVGLGMMFIALTLLASLLLWRGKLYRARWLLWIFVFAVVGAVAANQFGWIAAEVGRQPWIVHPPLERGPDGEPLLDDEGFLRYEIATVPLADGGTREIIAGLRTGDAVSEAVTSDQVLLSILLFGAVYILLFLLWLFVLNRKIQAGPELSGTGREPKGRGLAEAAGALADRSESLTG
jgi:cytochrome d ubiquinol oxidase subunit I